MAYECRTLKLLTTKVNNGGLHLGQGAEVGPTVGNMEQ